MKPLHEPGCCPLALPPLALYIHLPWCERKCPYCDFNSHVSANIPEADYIEQLLAELRCWQAELQQRPLQSIFIGGGTPSLFSGAAIDRLLNGVQAVATINDNCEITLEANPGSAERQRFKHYRAAGVNRLSLGVQSFDNEQLQGLGRIHNRADAYNAIRHAQQAGFANINIDLIYSLSGQTPAAAVADLRLALQQSPAHLSWYQLTIEPNTAFYTAPPPLPSDSITEAIEHAGWDILAAAGFNRYEVSAWSLPGKPSRHNMNYWEFGDYIGIGAGAHGKLTTADGLIYRTANTRQPNNYLARKATAKGRRVSVTDVSGEFMLNVLRLREGADTALFEQRTGLPIGTIDKPLQKLRQQQLLHNRPDRLACTETGYALLNSVVEQFLQADSRQRGKVPTRLIAE